MHAVAVAGMGTTHLPLRELREVYESKTNRFFCKWSSFLTWHQKNRFTLGFLQLQLPTGCVLLLCLPSSRTRVCAVNDESDWNAKFDPLSSLSKVPSMVFLICAGNGNANVPQGLYIIVQMYCLYVWNRNAPPPRVLYIIDCANWTWPALEWLPQASLNFSTAFDIGFVQLGLCSEGGRWKCKCSPGFLCKHWARPVQMMEIQIFCTHHWASTKKRYKYLLFIIALHCDVQPTELNMASIGIGATGTSQHLNCIEQLANWKHHRTICSTDGNTNVLYT